MPPPVFRFAPSPNGYLHLGHAFSALLNFDLARQTGGRLLLRIEDIDLARCKPEFEAAIYEDLAWLGIAWEQPVRRQSRLARARRRSRRRGRHGGRPAGSVGRRHPRAQGNAHQLSPLGGGRRCLARGDGGGARSGPVLVDQRPPAIAATAWPAAA